MSGVSEADRKLCPQEQLPAPRLHLPAQISNTGDHPACPGFADQCSYRTAHAEYIAVSARMLRNSRVATASARPRSCARCAGNASMP
jgi:hypothetical protein